MTLFTLANFLSNIQLTEQYKKTSRTTFWLILLKPHNDSRKDVIEMPLNVFSVTLGQNCPMTFHK